MLIIIHAGRTISRFLTTDAITSNQITSHLIMVVEMVESTTTVRHLETHLAALSEHTKETIQPLVPLTQVDATLTSANALKSVVGLLVNEADMILKNMALVTTHKRVVQATTMANGTSIEEISDATSIPTTNASVNLIVLLTTHDMTKGNFAKSAILKAHTDQYIVDARRLHDAHPTMNNSRATTSTLASITIPMHLVANSLSTLLKRDRMTNITLAKQIM